MSALKQPAQERTYVAATTTATAPYLLLDVACEVPTGSVTLLTHRSSALRGNFWGMRKRCCGTGCILRRWRTATPVPPPRYPPPLPRGAGAAILAAAPLACRPAMLLCAAAVSFDVC